MGPEISAATCVDRPGSCCRAAEDGSDARSRFVAGLPSTGAAAAPAWSGAGFAEGVLAVATVFAAGVLVAGEPVPAGLSAVELPAAGAAGAAVPTSVGVVVPVLGVPGSVVEVGGVGVVSVPEVVPVPAGGVTSVAGGVVPLPVPG